MDEKTDKNLENPSQPNHTEIGLGFSDSRQTTGASFQPPFPAQNQSDFVSLSEASKLTHYHQDYLGFLCRTGKLKGFKMGRNWVTTRAALDDFIKNYKNGISEVLDETGNKIPVHVASEQANIQSLDRPGSGQNNQQVQAPQQHIIGSAPALPVQQLPEQIMRLSNLKKEVFENIENRIDTLSRGLAEAEQKTKKIADQAEQALVQNSIPAVVPIAMPAVTRAAERLPLMENFVSNFDLPSETGTEPQRQNGEFLAGLVLGKEKIKQLYGSFARPVSSNLPLILATGIIALTGLVASVAWSSLISPKQPDVRGGITNILYSKSGARNSTSGIADNANSPVVVNGQDGTQIINQLLGLNESQVYSIIDDRLNAYLARGKFKGQNGAPGAQGPQGPAGAGQSFIGGPAAPIAYVGSENSNGTIGSIAGFSQLSGDSLSANQADIISLNVRGGSDFNGNASFSGSTTIADLNVSNINPGFTAGSVVFQGANGLSQDNGNLFYTASTSQLSLGTTTPDASSLLELDSSSKGFLAPRMTQAQRDAIASPAAGLLIFNTDTDQYNFFNGTAWSLVGSGTGGSSGVATGTPGSFAYYQSFGTTVSPENILFLSGSSLGIGTTAPSSELFLQATGSPTNLFTLASASGQTLLTVTAGGNLGIGTSTPGSALSVVGDALLTGDETLLGQLSVGATSTLADAAIGRLTVSGSSSLASTTLTVLTAGQINVSGLSTLATTTISQLTLTSALTPASGGTGTTTLGNLALGGGLAFTSGDGSQIIIGTSTAIGLSPNVIANVATGTTGNIFNISTSTNSLSINLPFASSVNTGQLQNSDWLAFNNKLSGSGANNYLVKYTGSSTTGNSLLFDNGSELGINSSSPAAIFTVQGSSTQSTLQIFAVASSSSAQILSILANGNVGINSSSPVTNFSVAGNIFASGGLGLGVLNATAGSLQTSGNVVAGSNVRVGAVLNCDNSASAIQTDGSGQLTCGTITSIGGSSAGGWTWISPNIVHLATSTDLVGIGVVNPTAKLAVGSTSSTTPVLSLTPVSGQTADILDIYNTSGATSSVITSAGYFGINTTSPVSQLSVVGDGYFNGNLTATGNQNIGDSLNVTGSTTLSSLTAGTVYSTGSGGLYIGPASDIGSGTIGQDAYYNGVNTLTSSADLLNNGTVVGVNASSSAVSFNIQGTGSLNPFKVASSSGSSILQVFANQSTQLAVDATTTAGGTLTASTTPAVLLGSNSLVAGSANGTYLGINSPSSFGGNFVQFENSGLNRFKVDSSGNITAVGSLTIGTILTSGTIENSGSSENIKILGSLSSTSGYEVTLGSENALQTPVSGVNGIAQIQNTFAPTSGTGTFNSLSINPTINQTGISTGITRGIILAPTLTSVFDYRNLETAATTTTLSTSTNISTAYNVLFNPLTYTSASSSLYTLANASTLNIAGAPNGTTASTTISSSTALSIQGVALTSVTNSYGLYVNANSGASNNYAAAFMGGNVGIGTTTPSAALSVQGTSGNLIQAFNGGTSEFSVNSTGLIQGTFLILSPTAGVTGLQINGTSLTSQQMMNTNFTASSGNGQSSKGLSIIVGDSTTGGGGFRAIYVNTLGALSSATGTKALMDLETNSASVMEVLAGGNIGLGTSTPAAQLTVASSSTTQPTVLIIATSSQTSNLLTIASSSGSSYLNVSAIGNVSIATLTPSSLVMSDANNNLSSVQLGTGLSFSGNTLNAAGSLSGGTTGYDAIWTSPSTLTAGALLDNGTVAGIGATSSTVSFNIQGSGILNPFNVASSSGSSLLTVSANGNVGIGTSVPQSTLAVVGAAGTTNAFTVASSTGLPLFWVNPNGRVNISSNLQITPSGFIVAAGGTQITLAGNNTNNAAIGITLSNNSDIMTGTSGTYGIAGVGSTGDIFGPTSGTAVLNTMVFQNKINQTGSASGITRGLYLNQILTSVADYRSLEVAATTTTLSTSSAISTAYNVLFNPFTYASASSSIYTLANASTLNLATPLGSSTATVTNASALMIQGNAVSNVTNAYGAIINAPTGAINNYAAIFNGGNVGIGTTTPAALLTVGSGTNTTAANGINFGDDTADLYRSGAGIIQTDASVFILHQIQPPSGGTLSVRGNGCGGGCYQVNILANSTQSYANGSGGILEIGRTNADFQPSSGTGNFAAVTSLETINQTGSASGITRGIYLTPSLKSVYDYRSLETASGISEIISNAANPASQVYNVLFNPITYGTASTSTYTIATSSTLTISGAPIASTTGNTLLTNSYGALIQGGTLNASTTNGAGLYVNAPTGATNNYAAIFNGGNVGIGTTSPGSLLTVDSEGLGATPSNGLTLQNLTAATAGVNSQASPALYLSGTGLKTNGNTSQSSIIRMYNTPIAGYSGVGAQLNFDISANSGAYSTFASLNSSTGWANLITAGTLSANGAGNNYMLGNVGIGTTTPIAALSFASSTLASGGINFGDATADLYRSGAGTIKTDGQLSVSGGAAVIASGTFQANLNGTALFGNINNNSGNNTTLYGSGATNGFLTLKSTSGAGTADYIKFVVGNNGGTEAMRIITNGNVGIGTTAPSSLLFVQSTSSQTSNLLTVASSSGSSYLNVSAIGNVSIATLTPSSLVMSDANSNLESVQLGTGLSFSGNTLNAAGSLSGGTTGYDAIWTSPSTLAAGALLDNGAVAGIGATSSAVSFNIQGTGTLNPFNVASSSGASELVVTRAGNVGIGTTTAGQTLAIQGSGAQDILNVVSSSGTSNLYINSAGNIGVDNQYPIGPLDVGNGITNGGDGQTTEIDGYLSTPWLGMGEWQNFLVSATNFSASQWIKVNMNSVAAATATSPLDALLASNLSGTSATGNISQAVVSGSTTPWTFSVYLKSQGGATTTALEIDTNVASGTPTTFTIGPSWQRYAVTSNLTGVFTSVVARIVVGTSAIAAWGPQLEQSSYARPYGGGTLTTALNSGYVFPGAGVNLSQFGTFSGVNQIDASTLIISASTSATASSTDVSATLTLSGSANTGLGAGVLGSAIRSAGTLASNSPSTLVGVSGTATFSGAANTGIPLAYGVYGQVKNSGVGTTTLAYSVYGDAPSITAGSITNAYAGGFNGNVWVGGNLGLGTTSASSLLTLQGTTSTASLLNIASSSGSSVLYVANSGNVGIGTTSPQAALYIQGSSDEQQLVVRSNSTQTTVPFQVFNNVGGSILSVTNGGTLTGGILDFNTSNLIGNGSGSQIILTVTGTTGQSVPIAEWGRTSKGIYDVVDQNGQFGIGTITPQTLLQVQASSSYSSDLFDVSTSTGQSYLHITSGGNVGIATTTPSQKLVVAGNEQLTGALFDSTNASGTPGMLLETTGSGTQWVATSTLGITGGAGVTGGTVGYDAMFTSPTSVSKGIVLDNGTVAGINATSSTVAFELQGSGTLDPFDVASSSGTSFLHVTQAGNVGIGTTTPADLVDIQGTSGNLLNLINGGTSEFKVTSAGLLSLNGEIDFTAGNTFKASSGQPLSLYGEITNTNAGYNILEQPLGPSISTSGEGGAVKISSTFSPASGSATNNLLDLLTTINQKGNASGTTTSLYFNPTVTQAYQYINLLATSTTVNLDASTTPALNQYNALFNPITYNSVSTTAVTTLNSAATMALYNPQVANQVIISSSSALSILGGTLNASTTNAYGIYLQASTGASSNYAAAIMGGNVGIGTSAPTSNLLVQGTAGQSGSLLTIASSSGATGLTVLANGDVGIGKNTAVYPLDVAGTIAAGQVIITSTNSGGVPFNIRGAGGQTANLQVWASSGGATTYSVVSAQGWLGIGTTTPTAQLSVASSSTTQPTVLIIATSSQTSNLLTVASSSGSPYFNISSIGNVNVATLTPSSLVMSDANSNLESVQLGTGLSFSGNTLNATGGGLSGGTNGYNAIWTSPSALGTGAIIDNGSVAGVNATSSTVSFNIQGTGTLNPFNVASSSGASELFVASNGNVGIGTTTPTQALSVVGSVSNLIGGNANITQVATTSVGNLPASIYVSGRYVYVANSGSNTISVVDISNPSAPIQVATANVGTNPYSVYVSGRYAYVANRTSNTISVVDISNPTAPVQVATTTVGTNPFSIYVSGRYAYVANINSSNISVVDISNPTAPVQVATTSVGTNPVSVYVSGRYAYVANINSSNISVVDISNPKAPTQVATTSVGTNPISIYVSGRYAYVANYSSNNISVVDISNPLAPIQIATTTVGTSPNSIYVSGRYAYVANYSSNNISVVDISNPLAPVQVATTSVGTNPISIYVSGRYAYVANLNSNTISVVDISGTETTSLVAGSADIGNLQVRNDALIAGQLADPGWLERGSGRHLKLRRLSHLRHLHSLLLWRLFGHRQHHPFYHPGHPGHSRIQRPAQHSFLQRYIRIKGDGHPASGHWLHHSRLHVNGGRHFHLSHHSGLYRSFLIRQPAADCFSQRQRRHRQLHPQPSLNRNRQHFQHHCQ